MNNKSCTIDENDLTESIDRQQSILIPRNQKRVKLSLLKNNVKVQCQWDGCSEFFETSDRWIDFHNFEQHLIAHVYGLQNPAKNSTHNLFICEWQDCKYSVSILKNLDDFYLQGKHLCEHAQHVYLMALGETYMRNCNLNKCESDFFHVLFLLKARQKITRF